MGVVDGVGGRYPLVQGHIGAIGNLSVVVKDTVNKYFTAGGSG